MPEFSERSKEKLATCHPDLQALFNEVIRHVDCSILCGHRGEQEQNEAFENGKSKLKYPDSKHNTKPSKAVDAAPYPIDWNNKKSFEDFAAIVMPIASSLGIKIKWGGLFKTLGDLDHFELY